MLSWSGDNRREPLSTVSHWKRHWAGPGCQGVSGLQGRQRSTQTESSCLFLLVQTHAGQLLSSIQGCSVQGEGSPGPRRMTVELSGQLLKASEMIMWRYACLDTWGFRRQQWSTTVSQRLPAQGRGRQGHCAGRSLARLSCKVGTTEQSSPTKGSENIIFTRTRASV